MSLTIAPATRKSAPRLTPSLNGVSLEAEIRSLYSLAPESMKQLGTLFAESVVEACTAIAGASSGEALVRRIGDERLRDPEHAYNQIDALLGKGSDTVKKTIELRFRSKVRRFYRISMSFETRRPAAH